MSYLEEIKPFAEAIVGECCRLPLAIIIVGAAIRRKTGRDVGRCLKAVAKVSAFYRRD